MSRICDSPGQLQNHPGAPPKEGCFGNRRTSKVCPDHTVMSCWLRYVLEQSTNTLRPRGDDDEVASMSFKKCWHYQYAVEEMKNVLVFLYVLKCSVSPGVTFLNLKQQQCYGERHRYLDCDTSE